MMQQQQHRNNLRLLDLKGWYEIGRLDYQNFRSFNPPTGAGASYYLAGWMKGENERVKKFFTTQ